MNKVIENAYIRTLIEGHYIGFYLENNTLSIYNVKIPFSGKHSISILNIPSSIGGIPVTSIEYNGLTEVDSLQFITLPDTITTIGERAFSGCINLKEITIPGSIKNIPFSFQSCDSLTKVFLHEGIETISSGAFSDCENIFEISFPKSLKYIDYNAFNQSKKIQIVHTNGNEQAINFAKKRNIPYILA